VPNRQHDAPDPRLGQHANVLGERRDSEALDVEGDAAAAVVFQRRARGHLLIAVVVAIEAETRGSVARHPTTHPHRVEHEQATCRTLRR
jgi:hypothetical protein